MNTLCRLGLVAALIVTAPGTAHAGPLTDACAAEAASRYETGYEATGKLQFEMDIPAAIVACEAALAAEPSLEVEAWLGRTYRIAGRSADALEQSRAAAEAGNLLAMQTVGDMLSDGAVEGADPAEGLAMLARAAELGFPPAVNSLGYSYAVGRGVEADERRALALYRESADLGYGLAAANVGQFYQQGKAGLDVDLEGAVVWFRRAVELDDTIGMYHLGASYYYGNGVPVDFAEALPLLERSAAQGMADSIGTLGHAHQFGNGVAIDYAKALELYTRAYGLGAIWTASYIGGLHVDGVDRDLAEARRWIDIGLLHDHPYALYLTGRIYEDGLGTEANGSLARTLYDKAFTAGLLEAEALARIGHEP